MLIIIEAIQHGARREDQNAQVCLIVKTRKSPVNSEKSSLIGRS